MRFRLIMNVKKMCAVFSERKINDLDTLVVDDRSINSRQLICT